MRIGKGSMKLKLPTRMNANMLADLAFIFFFSSPFIQTAFAKVLSVLGMAQYSRLLTMCVVYLPVLFLCFLAPRKAFVADFAVVFVGIIGFFALSLIIHPEYAYWYGREVYGVWDYVLFPNQAIYAYLFIRLVNDPKRIRNNMKIASWLMYVYFVYLIIEANQRGYWYGVSTYDANAKTSYSVSFGYDVLLYMLFFLYDAIMHRKVWDILGAGIGGYMILTCGSRGPVLFIAIFVALMGLLYFKNSRNKWIIMTLVISALVAVYIFYDVLLTAATTFLSSLNINSRTITMLLDGSVSEDNGRKGIWEAAAQMINENPWGYGAMGSQHVIANIIAAGYPHSVVLELMIDFGVILGAGIFVFLMYNACQIIFNKDNRDWAGVFLPLFCTSCQLFLSMCYWSSTGFWASIAIGVNCYLHRKQKKRRHLAGHAALQLKER